MHPVLFEIPGLGFPIRSFGVLVAAGIFFGIWLWGRLLGKYGDDPAEDPIRGSQVALWIVVGVLLGARLMYVVVEVSRYVFTERTELVDEYLAADDKAPFVGRLSGEELATAAEVGVGHNFVTDPLQVLFIWKGGLVMYGGLLGGILLGAWGARKHGLAIWNAFDTALVSSFFGLAIGRWGCLLVGDDHGSVVPEGWAGAPFPLTITVPSIDWLQAHPESLFPHELAGEVLWATQVWMSVNAIAIGLVGWWILSRRRFYGQAGTFMLAHYAVTRFAIEAFRGDEVRGLWFGDTVSTSQLVSIAGLSIAAVLWVKRPGGPVAPARAA